MVSLPSQRMLFVALLALLVAPVSVVAQSVGKISGLITDATTGDPLPGAQIYLEENNFLGTITDENGRYFLLSVPPGKYTVVMQFIGFATLKQANVEVFSGRTTPLDGELREEVIQGEEIIVQAERPIVTRDRTSTVSFISQETIDKLPVQEVSDLVRFQPGVVTNSNGGFNFRGGRQRETAYLIDGIPVQDVFNQGGGNTVDIEVQSVQELQVFTGTFDAELGGAQSGVVSVTTRDPGQELQGSLMLRSGGFFAGDSDRFIEGGTFNPTESKEVAVTLSGPISRWKDLGFFFSGRYDDRVGHLKGTRLFNAEDGFRIDTYRRWYRDVYQPDDTRLIALDTARTPSGELILGRDGQPLTFGTGNGKVVDMDWSRRITLNPKFVLRPSSRSQLSYAALFNDSEGQGYSNSRRFAPDFRSTGYSTTLQHIITYKHAFGNNKVWNLRGSYKWGRSESYAFDSINDPRIQYRSASDDITGFSFGATDNGASESRERRLIIASDFTWQINEWNELKTGFQYSRFTFEIEDLDRDWVFANNPDSLFLNLTYPPATNFDNFEDYFEAIQAELPILVPELERFAVDDSFDQSPTEFAYYIQDKMEIDSRLVVKTGLRFEYFNVGEDRLIDPRTPTDRIGRADNFESTPAKFYVSPRLGVSYPISETGAFRVAYGHFVQMPAYREMLKNPIFADINVGRLEDRAVGNPDLKPERTIKYEMGLQQQLTEFIGFDVNLFYKNIRNLLGTEILGTLDNVQYFRTVNRDYGLVRGGTFAIATRPMGMLLSSSFDITYSDARGSSSSSSDVASVAIAGRSGEVGEFILERNIIPLNWDQRLTANLAATIGEANDWSVGFVSQLATGQPYTPSFLDPSLDFPDNEFDNGENKPVIFTFDLNAEKRWQVGRASYGLRLQVNNVFNYLNERFVNSVSGRADQIIRLPVVQTDRDRVNDFVGIFSAADDDSRPHWYSTPRQILVGLTMNF